MKTGIRCALAALALSILATSASAAPCDGLFANAFVHWYRAAIAQPPGGSTPVIATVSIHNPGVANINVILIQAIQGSTGLQCDSVYSEDTNRNTCLVPIVINPGDTIVWTVALGTGGTADILSVGATGTTNDLLPLVSAELTKQEFDYCANYPTTQLYDHVWFVRDGCR